MSVPRYWREIPSRYTLAASSCGRCGAVHHPPRRICPVCRRDSMGNMKQMTLSGHGRILAWTRVHRPAPGYELSTPYVLAMIETDEGCRVLGQVVDCDEPDDGLAVVATFRRLGADGPAGVIQYGMKWRPGPVVDDSEE